MLWSGVVIFLIGALWTVFKGRVVWDIAHDLFNGGGAPKLDFPVLCPIPLAAGASLILSGLNALPFRGFGLALYVGLAACVGMLLWWFYRVGATERQRQSLALERPTPTRESSGS